MRHTSKVYKGVGYGLLGSGVALLAAGGGVLYAGGGVLYYYWGPYVDRAVAEYQEELTQNPTQSNIPYMEYQEKRNKAYDMMNVSYGLLATGGGLVITGMILVIIDATSFVPRIRAWEEGNRSALDVQLAPIFHKEFTGIALTGTF